MEDKALIYAKSEASYLLQGITFQSISEFELFSFELLNEYIIDKDRLADIVNSKSFACEVMFLKWANGTVFEDFVNFFFKNLRTAQKFHSDDTVKCYVDFDLKFHEALVSYQDSAAMSLVNATSLENKRTMVKSAFNSIGDIIESSLYPQLNLLYRILTCSKDSCLYSNNTDLNSGKIVSELIDSSEVIEAVLKRLLSNVPLNQWRNISNHSSYQYDKASDSIFCEYGTNNNNSVTLKYEELWELFKSIDCIQILLKTCLELSSFELVEMKRNVIDDERYEVTRESIMSQIGNLLAVLNYDVLSVEKILNQWKINISDVSSLGVIKFRELGSELIPYFAYMYKYHGIIMELEIFDIKGRTFQKMSLGDISKLKQ